MNWQDYLMMLQMQQQGQPQEGQPQGQMNMTMPENAEPRPNPILSGAQTGIDAARQTIELSEAQNRRALGTALTRFAANMANPPQEGWGPGFGGQARAITASLDPALSAYLEQQKTAEAQNAELAKMAELKRHHNMQEMKDALYGDLEERKFNESKSYNDRYLDHLKGKRGKDDSTYNELQDKKHQRLLNKDYMAYMAYRNKLIKERLADEQKSKMAFGAKYAELREQITKEVDEELAPLRAKIESNTPGKSKPQHKESALQKFNQELDEAIKPKDFSIGDLSQQELEEIAGEQ